MISRTAGGAALKVPDQAIDLGGTGRICGPLQPCQLQDSLGVIGGSDWLRTRDLSPDSGAR